MKKRVYWYIILICVFAMAGIASAGTLTIYGTVTLKNNPTYKCSGATVMIGGLPCNSSCVDKIKTDTNGTYTYTCSIADNTWVEPQVAAFWKIFIFGNPFYFCDARYEGFMTPVLPPGKQMNLVLECP